jgi:hypothetical protein
MCAVYIRNRVFTGHKPNLANMHSFGTICFAYVQEKKKLDARGERGVFIGYDKGYPGSRGLFLLFSLRRGEEK